ncbi:MAG TPA: hypothetical protein DDW50_00230 [Firmicutes bacterium]|jgi:hypothetical protein|nr:hypothetical protein [Bacillota bacterium]
MKSVYLLQHSYEVNGCDETKVIGIYETKEKAEETIEKLKRAPGFARYPDSFCIDQYEINQDHWIEGFMAWEED